MIRFVLYQIKSELTHEKGFIPLRMMLERFKEVYLKDYDIVYVGDINDTDDSDIILSLEGLFHRFNANHPSDYNGRSMSVSDVVMVKGSYYYCDSIGFKEIEPIKSEL